jgi:hypothetical protein
MGVRIKHTGNELKERWVLKMPRFFRGLVIICACIVGTAFGVNTMLQMTGAVAHEWWTDIYPLLIGVPTGMAIVCKLTVAGGYKEIDPNRLTRGNIILDHDIDEQGDGTQHVEPREIEPYDDRDDA